MTWRYETSYNVGPDNHRVYRRLEGFEAFCAIGFDLLLSIGFALVGFAVRLAWSIVVATARFAYELARLPLRVLRNTLGRCIPRPAPKPSWAGFEEI
ncbi:MAG TPA: hypothetical protein VG406_23275 [Isosphaeraceae bacterium]|jgi:hypothetical protein|nr:hypothetical protein [Isosphaeraceae bacterium]